MTPSLAILSALPPDLSLNADHTTTRLIDKLGHVSLPPSAQVQPFVGFSAAAKLSVHAESMSIPIIPGYDESDYDEYDDNDDNDDDASSIRALRSSTNGNLGPAHPRQWTGMPIRAIVPLPRRSKPPVVGARPEPSGMPVIAAKNGLGHENAPAAATGIGPATTSLSDTAINTTWDADIEMEEGSEDEEGDQGGIIEDDDSDDDDAVDITSERSRRCCSYQSITAMEGLSAWSFEELRAECYAQSLVARGTKPPPATWPSLAIPPAFMPRTVSRS